MPASVAMPAVRQNRSKLAPTCCQASSTIAAGTTSAGVVHFVMALLSFVASAPRAYWLKAGNAYLTFSTSAGTSPCCELGAAEVLRIEIPGDPIHVLPTHSVELLGSNSVLVICDHNPLVRHEIFHI